MKKTFLLFFVMSSLFLIGGGGFKLNAQTFDITYGSGDAAFTLTYTPIDGSTCSVQCTSGNGPDSSTEITIPQTVSNGTSTYIVTTIPESGFDGASSALNGQEDNFTKLVLPNTITSIGRYAFYGWANLAELYLGTSENNNTLDIAVNAFNSTTKITTIYCYYTTPPHINDVNGSFDANVRNNANLYVPEASINSYNNYNYSGNTLAWCKFQNISKIVDSEPKITLTANPTTIIANGNNATTFTVTSNVDGDVTNSCTIYQVNGTEDVQLPGNTFSTTTAGTYQFYAKYGDLQSETIPVTANEQTLSISATPTTIVANGNETTTFTVKLDGETINSGYQIYKGTNPHTGNTFSTTEAGNYSFYATYTSGTKTLTSNTVYITANEQTLTLEVNPTEIVADGTAAATFTVKLDGVNLNSGYQIYNGTDPHTGNTFTTTNAGTYTFYATYNTGVKNLTSGTVTITATEPEPEPEPGDETIEYIEISGNTSGTSTSVPVKLYNTYSISQQYYLKDEINKDKATITSISFSCNSIANNSFTTNIVVYMRNTTDASFSGTTMEQMNANELVYNGSVTFTSDTWCEITLQNEFEYTGNNILLCVWENQDGYTSGDDQSYFNTFEVETSRILHKTNSNGTISDPTTKANSNCSNTPYQVPQVKFGILSEPEDPIVLHIDKETILANGEDKVTFTVTQGEDTGTGNSVTNECTFYVNGEAFGGNTFTCTEAGSYEVYAMKDNLKSDNTETFTAVYPIVLTADKTSIYNNNTDVITFSVKQGEVEAQGAKIYYTYNNSATTLSGNTFKTATAGYYEFFATYTDANYGAMESNHINVTVNIEPLESSDEVITINGDGSVSITYNKGEGNEYTLIARLIDPEDTSKGAYIVQDNVYELGTGEQYQISRKDVNKPEAETMLMMPETVPFGTEEVTVTRVENFAFDNKFEYYGFSDYNPGNPLNDYFTGVIIPGTIKELGMYSFAFETETKVVCYAMTPPTVYIDEKEGEILGQGYFLQNTYNNIVLYVPVNCVDTYKQTPGWGLPLSDGHKDCYFKNIYPIETPTFIGEGSWDNVANWDPTYGFPEEGEDVLINGNAVIEAGSVANVGEIYIIAGSGSITMKDGGQLIHTNANVEVTVEKEIKGYGDGVSWYTISSPLVNNEPADEVTNLLSNNYDLYYYNEPTHYWFNYKDKENNANFTTIDPARGYLYANSNDVTLKFTGAVNHKEEVSFNLDMKDNILVGFNLIGNPFTHNIYKGKGAAIDNDNLTIGHYSLSNAGRWGAVLSNSEAIAPCQSILVQTIVDNETLVIRKKNNAPTVRDEHATLDIVVSNGKYSDEAHVMFTEGIGLGKIAHMNKDIPMVYVNDNGSHYAIATMEEDVEEIAVGFEAMTMGEYTIGIKAADCDYSSIILTDNITGKKTDLLKGNYTFMALTTDRPQRFVLTMNNDIDTDTDTDFIYINNNEMVISNIKGNGQVMIYDIMGRPMAEYNVSGSANISVESFASGVYIVRMTDDNGVKSQKIVLN